MTPPKTARLGSLDILRGFDLFVLVFFQPVFMALARRLEWAWLEPIMWQFSHVPWEGFTFWDLIMPLFMFMAGAAMPFAFRKYLANGGKTQLYQRIFKRVILLWILGMIAQGNLLGLDPSSIRLYSNTLQAIAMGYLISAVLLMHCTIRWQLVVTASFLFIYWALLTFVQINGFGGGNFTPDYNLAEYVDREILGRFRDRARITEEGLAFGNYRYTWILSSLNFGATVMSGVFAGHIMKSGMAKTRIIMWLALTGVLLVAAGLLLSLHMPIIKRIWTSSMTLYSSGWCFLLMALFYYLVDYRDFGKYLNWLKIYGMNSILAYMLFQVVNFGSISRSLLHGTEQYLGEYYGVLLGFSNAMIVFFMLLALYRQRKFLKV